MFVVGLTLTCLRLQRKIVDVTTKNLIFTTEAVPSNFQELLHFQPPIIVSKPIGNRRYENSSQAIQLSSIQINHHHRHRHHQHGLSHFQLLYSMTFHQHL